MTSEKRTRQQQMTFVPSDYFPSNSSPFKFKVILINIKFMIRNGKLLENEAPDDKWKYFLSFHFSFEFQELFVRT